MLTHIRGLPRDSAFSRHLRQDWDIPTELLAQVLDAVNFQTYAMRVQLGHDRDALEPTTWPRPSEQSEDDLAPSTPDEIRAFIGGT